MILDFNNWLIEGFKADINDSEKEKTIDIELSGSGQRRVFKLVDGEPKEITKNHPDGEEISDESLKDYVVDVITGIDNIKDQDRADEINRITGNYPEIKKELSKNYDKYKDIIRRNKNEEGKPDEFSLWDQIKDLKEPGDYKFIDLSGIMNDVYKNIFEITYRTANNTTGKGEFLLPVLYTDVYKNHTLELGDNYLITPDEKRIDLELKSKNAQFKEHFNVCIEDVLSDELKKNIIFCFIKSNLYNGDLDRYNIIFSNNNKLTGFLIIKGCKSIDDFESVYNKIKNIIVFDNTKKGQETYTYKDNKIYFNVILPENKKEKDKEQYRFIFTRKLKVSKQQEKLIRKYAKMGMSYREIEKQKDIIVGKSTIQRFCKQNNIKIDKSHIQTFNEMFD